MKRAYLNAGKGKERKASNSVRRKNLDLVMEKRVVQAKKKKQKVVNHTKDQTKTHCGVEGANRGRDLIQ